MRLFGFNNIFMYSPRLRHVLHLREWKKSKTKPLSFKWGMEKQHQKRFQTHFFALLLPTFLGWVCSVQQSELWRFPRRSHKPYTTFTYKSHALTLSRCSALLPGGLERSRASEEVGSRSSKVFAVCYFTVCKSVKKKLRKALKWNEIVWREFFAFQSETSKQKKSNNWTASTFPLRLEGGSRRVWEKITLNRVFLVLFQCA